MPEIRTFVAVEFSEELKKEISQIQSKLKKELGQFKWVSAGNYHLTLKFLGDVDTGKIPELVGGLKKAVCGMEDFDLGFAQVGGFPKIYHPRVVWLGVNQGKEELINLQKVVEQELFAHNFPAEKHAYSPHLTLARARHETDLAVAGRRLSQLKVAPTRTDLVKSIRIMKSDLRPTGPIYTCLEEIFF